MMARLSIVIGLVVGIAVAALLLGGIYALAPEDQPLPSAEPSIAASSMTPGPAPSASASGSAAPEASPSATVTAGQFRVGQPAPALIVPRVGGGTIDLAALKGRPVWVDFMTTGCPSCKDEFQLMNGFAARFEDTGLAVVAIDVGEDEAAVAAFGESLGATFPLGLDEDRQASLDWDAVALPVHFWIDADGIVQHRALGGIGPDVMVEGLRSILPGVDVTP
jgi:thiol-disulfide isomerase/thioredoxin